MDIRPTTREDLDGLKQLLDQTELFPSEMLPDMLTAYLNDPDCAEVWLTCTYGETAIGFCYAIPETLTDGTWNMLAIAISPDAKGQGAGHMITQHLETVLKDKGGRILIADTSGTDDYADARDFYERNGFTQEARVRDFWAKGDDKITYRKTLD